MQINYDRANAPTEPLTEALTQMLTQREHHRIATLGQNKIIIDHYRTQFLKGNDRVTRLLPRTRPSLWSLIIGLIIGTRKKAAIKRVNS